MVLIRNLFDWSLLLTGARRVLERSHQRVRYVFSVWTVRPFSHLESFVLIEGAINITGFRVLRPQSTEFRQVMSKWKAADELQFDRHFAFHLSVRSIRSILCARTCRLTVNLFFKLRFEPVECGVHVRRKQIAVRRHQPIAAQESGRVQSIFAVRRCLAPSSVQFDQNTLRNQLDAPVGSGRKNRSLH